MDASSDSLSRVELLAEEFLARQQNGERPTIDEYCERYPELAAEVRELFEGFLLIENLKPESDELSQTFHSDRTLNGQRLDRVADYRIIRELGRGGMGIVYEAEQESLRRRVALKVLPKQHAADKKSLERFQREARAAARMHHTNIVPVFDVGQTEDWVFYAMQLIQGQGLDLVIDDLKKLRAEHSQASEKNVSKLKTSEREHADRSIAASIIAGQFQQERLLDNAAGQQALSEAAAVATDEEALKAYAETLVAPGGTTISAVLPGQSEISTAETNRKGYFESVAHIGLQTARALSYAHARGIIHRDIKPSNLILDAAGTVWVTDFGLAKTSDEAMTHTGDILGTIRYMSPERFRGHCDARADLYSLGLTLYEMLVLMPAFSSSDRLRLIELVNKAEPEHPRAIDPDIPLDLETIVLKCIDKDPKRRYQSADELADDLQRFVADEPIKARRISLVERATRWGRHNKGLASALTAVVCLLLVINTVGPLMYLVQLQTNKQLMLAEADAERKARENEKLAQEQTELAEDMKALAAENDRSRRDAEKILADVFVDRGVLAAERSESAQAVLWFANAATLIVYDPRWQQDNLIRVQQYLGSATRPVRVFEHPAEWIEEMHFDATGRYLLTYNTARPAAPETGRVAKASHCQLWDVERGEALKLPDFSGNLTHATWNFNGQMAALGTSEGLVLLWNPQTNQVVSRWSFGESIIDLEFSADNRWLAIGAGKSIAVWNVDTETESFSLERYVPVLSLTLSKNGDRLAVISEDLRLEIYDCSSTTNRSMFPPVRAYQNDWSNWTPVPRSESRFVEGGDGLFYQAIDGLQFLDLREKRAYRQQSSQDKTFTSERIEQFAIRSGVPYLIASNGWEESRLQGFRDGKESVFADIQHRNLQPNYCSAFTVDGSELLTGGGDRLLRSWNTSDGTPGSLNIEHAAAVSRVSVSPEGRRFATAQQGGVVIVWERAQPVERTSGIASVDTELTGGTLTCISRDKRYIAPTGRSNRYARGQTTQVFEVSTRTAVGQPMKVPGLLIDAHFSFDGQQLLTISDEQNSSSRSNQTESGAGHLQVWNWQSGERLAEVRMKTQPRSLDVSPDGRVVAVLCTDGNIGLFDAATAQLKTEWQAVSPFTANNWYVYNGAIRFSPDGKRLVSWCTDHVARVWNVESLDSPATSRLAYEVQHRSLVRGIAFASDGELLATCSGGSAVDGDISRINTVMVTDTATGEPLAGPFMHPDWVHGIEFSPDANLLASACRDGAVRIWKWREGELALSAMLHNHEVHNTCFSEDGRFLITSSDDKLLHIWSVTDGKPLVMPRQLSGATWYLNKAGNTIITSGSSSKIELFDMESLQLGDNFRVDDALELTELVSGRRIVSGGDTPLTTNELVTRYRAARAAFPDEFKLEFTHLPQRLSDFENTGTTNLRETLAQHWLSVPSFSTALTLMLNPKNWSSLAGVSLSTSSNQSTYNHLYLARILVDCGCLDEYRKLRQTIRQELESSLDPALTLRLADSLMLLPDSDQDYGEIRRVCEEPREVLSENPSQEAGILQLPRETILALVSLREAKPDEAIMWARQAQADTSRALTRSHDVAALIEGLALQRMGQDDEARAIFTRVLEWLKAEERELTFSRETRATLATVLLRRILLREAGVEPVEPDPRELAERGRVHALFGHFASAAELLQQSLKMDPGDHQVLYHWMLLLTELENEEGLAVARQQLIDDWSATDISLIAERSAKAYLLSSDPGPDIELACSLADLAIEQGVVPSFERYFWHAKALAEYRRGNFEESLKWSKQIDDLNLNAESHLSIATRLLIALAENQLERTASAREHLLSARRDLKKRLQDSPIFSAPIWHLDDLWCRALEKEAIGLILNEPVGSEQAVSD